MSMIPDYKYKYRWYETIALNIIKMGKVPRHVAVTVDGNRRFAKKHNLSDRFGLMRAFEKMSDISMWCLEIGVKELTINLLPICSYGRKYEEIDGTLKFCTRFFKHVSKKVEKLNENGVKVRVIGNIPMLPKELQESIAETVLLTENNDKVFLNLALAYSSREEMANAIHDIIEESGDDLKPEDITEDLISQCLYTKESCEPDLFIRTSGVNEISDFLSWQLSGTILFFTEVLWPEMSLLQFACGIFFYQRALLSVTDFRQRREEQIVKDEKCRPDRVSDFLQKQDARRRAYLVSVLNANVKEHWKRPWR